MRKAWIQIVFVVAVVLAQVFLVPASAQDVKNELWQELLEKQPFHFAESEASVLYALSQFQAGSQVQMIYDPAKPGVLTFKFVLGGKELQSLSGHQRSVFREADNVLYFAHFGMDSSGCAVAAYDLKSGKTLWNTRLTGIGPVEHSAYRNAVTMTLSTLAAGELKRPVVSISGRESFGDYVEILDRETGKVLASKVYGQKR